MEVISKKDLFKVALLGNPNCGKSSLFNQLTGLRQKVGNFPGVTVDKKIGTLYLADEQKVQLIDLPGTYSFYPTSTDERIVVQTLLQPDDSNYPDAILYVADVTKLEKHLLLFTQVVDLGLPVLLVLNMSDVADQDGLRVDASALSASWNLPVVSISSRTGQGLSELKDQLSQLLQSSSVHPTSHYTPKGTAQAAARTALHHHAHLSNISEADPNIYRGLLLAHHAHWLPFLPEGKRADMQADLSEQGFESLKAQVEETMARYHQFTPVVRRAVTPSEAGKTNFSLRIDRILTHHILGPAIFFLLMLMVFQAIFSWAEWPMSLIEAIFGGAGELVTTTLSAGWWTDLLVDGILPGLEGVLIFIPQIAILFFLISLLEEVGYMARAAYMFDHVMQRFGLNGRSIVALISGGACAIPAIMSTRTIGNSKERLITILVTPFISCSARIPVYIVLIGFVVPPVAIMDTWITWQSLAFMGLYLLGILAALAAAWVFKLVLKTEEHSFLMLELPGYRWPVWRNVFLNVWEKVGTFVREAGRIILVVSMILWALASYGPSGAMQTAEANARAEASAQSLDDASTEDLVAAYRMEASFAGQFGKAIEPAITPLGYDWKIGIALLTSFAAREVFVGTMAVIYGVGSQDDEASVRERMAKERDIVTGKPVYTPATSLSLLLFYVFAMQCVSTLAVVRRETKSWKWPLIQFTFMTALAYLSALVAYQLLS